MQVYCVTVVRVDLLHTVICSRATFSILSSPIIIIIMIVLFTIVH